MPLFLPLLATYHQQYPDNIATDAFFFGIMAALNQQTSFLSPPVAMQSFEPITRRHPQIVELLGRVHGKELGSRTALNLVRHGLDRITGKQRCRALVGEGLDHGCLAYRKAVRWSRLMPDGPGQP